MAGLSNHMWNAIVDIVLNLRPGQDYSVPKKLAPHPSTVGFAQSLGMPKGETGHWRYALPDGRGVHVREFDTEYRIHWDRVDPHVDLIGHLRVDAPGVWIVLCGGLCALALMAIGKGWKSGALLGCLLGAMTVSPGEGHGNLL